MAADPPNFSGKWEWNKQRSKLDQNFSSMERGVIRIVHVNGKLNFRRAFVSNGIPEVIAFEYNIDGKEVAGAEDGMPTKSMMYWEGDALIFVTKYAVPRGQAVNTVKYDLLEEGRTLQAHERFVGPRLQYENVWIFNKATD